MELQKLQVKKKKERKKVSTSKNSLNCWNLNGAYCVSISNWFDKFLNSKLTSYIHSNPIQGRIKQHEHDIHVILEDLTNSFVNLFSENDLIFIYNSIIVNDSIRDDLRSVKEKVRNAQQFFIKECLLIDSNV